MRKELIIPLIASLIDDAIKKHDFSPTRGPRGLRGPSGKPFDFSENKVEIEEIIHSHISSIHDSLKIKISDLNEVELASLRGNDGKDFSLEESKEEISKIINEHILGIQDTLKLKFSDLSEEEKLAIRGPRGQRGKAGKDFSWDESKDAISNVVANHVDSIKDDLKLKFNDLTADEISVLRGKDGKDGINGKDFSWEESQDAITNIVITQLRNISEELKLKFSDLSEEDKDSLRLKFSQLTDEEIARIKGPRGQRGKAGKDFEWEEHKTKVKDILVDFVTSIEANLKLRYEDLTEEEKDSLKLKFSQLTDEEKLSLKLKFTDLTDEERLSLRGPRGQKGKRGVQGEQGPQGEQGMQGLKGDRGPMGLRGLTGPQGQRGLDGVDGQDAPVVTHVRVETYKSDEIYFVFEFSDGLEIETNKVQLPSLQQIALQVFGGGGSSESGTTTISVYKDGVLVADDITKLDFGSNLSVVDNGDGSVTIESTASGSDVAIYDEGNLVTDTVKSIDFIGASVTAYTGTVIANWPNLTDVDSMANYGGAGVGHIKVKIDAADAATKLSFTKTLGENMPIFSAISLVDSATIMLSDKTVRPSVDGILLQAGTTGNIRPIVMFGIVEDASFTWPLKANLYLGDTGQITTTFPLTGNMTLIGKSLGNGAIFIDIQPPEAL